jgi:hypothetical protein
LVAQYPRSDGEAQMRHSRISRCLLLLASVSLVPALSTNLIPRAHAYPPYSLTPTPASTSEGNTVGLVLSDSSAVSNIQYRFRFYVTDPAGTTIQSIEENYTTIPGQYSFSMTVDYPGPGIQGSNTLVGQYNVRVDEVWPTAAPGVAGTSFNFTITDSPSYQRTQTVNMHAAGYNVSETVTVTIRTQTNSTLVYSALVAASSGGTVVASWKSPRNAIIDTYVVTLIGTTTAKKTPDTQTFNVATARMSIGSISSFKSTYLRTQTMNFSFQPSYPDGSLPSTGIAVLILTNPSGSNTTLTAIYSTMSQTFNASYKTSLNDQGGTWTASLAHSAYGDAYGNTGPGTAVSGSSQLTPVTLIINISITTNTSLAVGQQLKFNATITYPDETILESGTVRAFLVFAGPPSINDSIPVAFDTSTKAWSGTYTLQSSDTGGQWSLIVRASDAPTPPNTGYASRIITVQNTTTNNNGPASFPLYYFGIIAALIAGAIAAVFLVFKKRGVKQTSLKIDLGAVQSEAGRIESSDFFQSVKDQVKKEKDEK